MGAGVRIGTVIAGFRVRSLIGEGAMGTVYLAEDVTSGQHAALKLLAPELARDERFRQRFLRESQVAASVDHPHIVPTVGGGEENGLLYLAMAYVDASDLRELLRRERRLQPERAVELVGQVARAPSWTWTTTTRSTPREPFCFGDWAGTARPRPPMSVQPPGHRRTPSETSSGSVAELHAKANRRQDARADVRN